MSAISMALEKIMQGWKLADHNYMIQGCKEIVEKKALFHVNHDSCPFDILFRIFAPRKIVFLE